MRCLTGNISMVIEEDLPAALDEIERLEKVAEAAKEMEAAFQESHEQGYTLAWNYRMQCAVEDARAALADLEGGQALREGGKNA